MTVATVKTVAARFLKSEKPEVLALKGAWGVGKTYAWNKLVLENKDEIKIPNYCYVSLFGVSSIAELRTAIFTKTQAVKRIGVKLDAGTINNEWGGILWDQSKNLLRAGSNFIKDLPYGKHITVGLETLTPHFIRNTIVCLDDFERVTAGTIKPEEILGLISELKEEKNCKVVLVFNEERLDNKDIYSKYREKVVDIELLYDPTSEEAAEIALPANLVCREMVKKYCVSLAVKNIRVLRKIVDLIEMVQGVAGQLHPQVMAQAVQTLVLVTWCYFDADDEKPTLQFLRKWNWFAFGLNKQKEEDPKVLDWSRLIQTYGLVHMDEFDLTIFNVIERGYLEETGFADAAKVLDAQFRAQELEQTFTAAWELFHNTFAANQEELIKSLTESFKTSVQYISPVNLSGTTGLLRQLGRNDLADELIDYYIDARATDTKIFDLKNNPFSDDIRDPAIRERFAKKIAEIKMVMPLHEAVIYIAEHSGWSSEHLEALQAASVEDFYILFKRDLGDQLSKIVGCCLQFEGRDGHKPIGKNARAALVRIGKENKLNAIRVQRFGIKVEALADDTNPTNAGA